VLREHHAITGNSVDIWCGELLLTVTAKIAISKVIGKNKDDVGKFIFFLGSGN